MKLCKRMLISAVWVISGTVLMLCSLVEVLDSFWGGMGSALIVIGIIQLIRQVRYIKNAEYRDNVNTEVNDERNKFISSKAWSWAGYLFVIIAAVAAIVFKLMGLDDYMMLSGGSVCLITLLYWICHLVLRKKY